MIANKEFTQQEALAQEYQPNSFDDGFNRFDSAQAQEIANALNASARGLYHYAIVQRGNKFAIWVKATTWTRARGGVA